MPDYRIGDTMQHPFGTLLGNVTIDNIAIDVFSNGDCNHRSQQRSVDAEGHYMGLQYQCVEFVRRYIYLRHLCNLALKWSAGDAHDWYDNRTSMGLVAVAPERIEVGDILTFRGGTYGHVAIVSRVDKNQYWMTSQNLFNNRDDIHYPLSIPMLMAGACLQDASGAQLRFQSLLRFRAP